MAEETARLVVEVVAGVIPGQPMDEHTRRYVLTSSQWQQAKTDGKTGDVLAELTGRAQGYAMLLSLQPDRVNWVRTEWLWL